MTKPKLTFLMQVKRFLHIPIHEKESKIIIESDINLIDFELAALHANFHDIDDTVKSIKHNAIGKKFTRNNLDSTPNQLKFNYFAAGDTHLSILKAYKCIPGHSPNEVKIASKLLRWVKEVKHGEFKHDLILMTRDFETTREAEIKSKHGIVLPILKLTELAGIEKAIQYFWQGDEKLFAISLSNESNAKMLSEGNTLQFEVFNPEHAFFNGFDWKSLYDQNLLITANELIGRANSQLHNPTL